jgi:hypothetical protein
MPQIPILPQKPNYTIHTSQAATTSRAKTQTADFSEAGESTGTDENDDRISWQAVSGRGKKRTSTRTTKLPTMKKNKPQETNNHQSQITVTNKFEALRQAETEGNTIFMYLCMHVYKGWAVKSSPCSPTFNNPLCFPF